MLTVSPATIKHHTTGHKAYLGRFDVAKSVFTFSPIIADESPPAHAIAHPEPLKKPIPLPSDWEKKYLHLFTRPAVFLSVPAQHPIWQNLSPFLSMGLSPSHENEGIRQFIIQPRQVMPVLSKVITALRKMGKLAKAQITFPRPFYFLPNEDISSILGLLDMAHRAGTTIHREPLEF